MSSFGYSGTITHALLMASDSDTTQLGRLPSSSRAPKLFYRADSFAWVEMRHPFVQLQLPSSGDVYVFRSPAAGALFAHVADHIVAGRVIFPAAGYLEVARAAHCAALSKPTSSAALQGVFFLLPLEMMDVPALYVETEVSEGRFKVRSHELGLDVEDENVHSVGAVRGDTPHEWHRVDHIQLRSGSCARAADVPALYDHFEAVALEYGPEYRTLTKAWLGADLVGVAQLRARAARRRHSVQVHPADLDDALCVADLIELGASEGENESDGETRVPFAVNTSRLRGLVAGELWAVRLTP